MTITRYDGLAIIPKRCDICNRLFWLEFYNTYYKEVGIEHHSLKCIKCRECMNTNFPLKWTPPKADKEDN